MTTLSRRRPHLFLIMLLCLSGVARAQSGGSVKMSGGVSGTVALSLAERAEVPGGSVRVTSSRNPDRSLTVTLSGAARGLTQVSVPIQIRSNTAYRLLTAAKADGTELSSLLVVGARPTGILVAADAAQALRVAATFDGRNGAGMVTPAGGLNRPDLSALSELLRGPRVSLGGTLLSPRNALEVTLSMTVEPPAGSQDWTIELLLSATPDAPF